MAKCIEKAESHCKSYPRCYGCGAYREPTNADRIRAMSDEELAEWALHKAPKIGRGYSHSLLGLIQWLKQTAEVE